MILNTDTASEMALHLLDIEAVKLSPEKPFTWTSGIVSPIYCDNRKTLSYPLVRNFIKEAFAEIIAERYPDAEVIAGVATAGIPHGVLVADALSLPFVYVRDKPKGHGLENQIEGQLNRDAKTVVIEDLISTGGSSLKAVQTLRAAGADILGLGAIFTYGFSKAGEAFQRESCPYFTLTDYPTLIHAALQKSYIRAEQSGTLLEWYKEPESWG